MQFLCVWAASHTIVLLSAVLWHMCVTISPLNSCLIIPNLREYSNKAFNAFFHMILRSRDSCSAAFIAVFREGTDSSAHLIGEEVWERADSLQTFTNKKLSRCWYEDASAETKRPLYTWRVARVYAQRLSVSFSGMQSEEITSGSIPQHNDTILVTGIGMYQTGGISWDQCVFVRCPVTTQPFDSAEGCCCTGVLQTFSWQMSSLSLPPQPPHPTLSLSFSLSL